MTLSKVDKNSLNNISSRLKLNPKSLFSLIKFESKWNPHIKNPYSSARGLIQFTDKTAKSLGYINSLDLVAKNPTIKSQLEGPVYQYLRPYSPFPTDQSLFLAVFYPKARYWPKFKAFPEFVQKVNPGIKTPNDYINFVYGRSKLKNTIPLIILILGGLYIYTTINSKKGVKYGITKNIKDSL